MTILARRALIIGVFTLTSVLPLLALAQCAPGANGFVPLTCADSSQKLAGLYASQDLSNFVNGLFKVAIAVGAIAAVLRISYAGFLYMGQADMWSHKNDAKRILGEVTLGLLLLLSVYLILYQINPDILTLNAIKNISPVPNP